MKLHPVGERVLVEPVKVQERTSAGGIVLPGEASTSAREGIVRAVPKEGGMFHVGERVLYPRSAGTRLESGLVLLDTKDVLAAYEGG